MTKLGSSLRTITAMHRLKLSSKIVVQKNSQHLTKLLPKSTTRKEWSNDRE